MPQKSLQTKLLPESKVLPLFQLKTMSLEPLTRNTDIKFQKCTRKRSFVFTDTYCNLYVIDQFTTRHKVVHNGGSPNFMGCYSTKVQVLWFKFCKALVTRYVLSHQTKFNTFGLCNIRPPCGGELIKIQLRSGLLVCFYVWSSPSGLVSMHLKCENETPLLLS